MRNAVILPTPRCVLTKSHPIVWGILFLSYSYK